MWVYVWELCGERKGWGFLEISKGERNEFFYCKWKIINIYLKMRYGKF